MRYVFIGAVAAGTSAAAKASRNDRNGEFVLYERDSFISYSSCGMPYYLGGEFKSREELAPRDEAYFKSAYGTEVKTRHEVLSINPKDKTIEVRRLDNGEIFTDHYDKLVIATGASAYVPQVEGSDREHVFALRTLGDMDRIKAYLDTRSPKSAVLVGTGFIGLEMAESLVKLGLTVHLLDRKSRAVRILDEDMSGYVTDYLVEKGIHVHTSAVVLKIGEKEVTLTDGRVLEADLVLYSTGVRPNTALAKDAGIEIGSTGAIKVDSYMQTSVDSIYACGDCIETPHLITGKPAYHPLGSTANKTGRIAGDNLTGGSIRFRGILGTSIFRIFDKTVAFSGLTEKEAVDNGFDVVVCHLEYPNKPEYMGGQDMIIKAVADKKDGRLLGAQIVGFEGVDKRIDVFVTAMTYGAKAEDLFHLDLAYAPPFATAKDPVMYTGMLLESSLKKARGKSHGQKS